ncbi:hypothetical protein TNCV_4872991 [Trichonephila clavipes]|nr:hypothetical protein TNCV_4872991 [Trichonephila clavipes]
MIASFVEENRENWDQFLHEFAFTVRTAVNETNKTTAELFLGRKIITPFSKLINVTEDTKYVGRDIERLFDEARRNFAKKSISLGENITIAEGGMFTSKVLEVKGNNLIIWKSGKRVTANIDQVRVYRPRQTDTISSDSQVETLYDEQ